MREKVRIEILCFRPLYDHAAGTGSILAHCLPQLQDQILPRLILTDKFHHLSAEGFTMDDLDSKLAEIK